MRELKKIIKLFTIVLVRPLTTPATWSQDELVDTIGHQPFAMCMSSNPSYRDLMCALACTAIYTPCKPMGRAQHDQIIALHERQQVGKLSLCQ